MSRFRNFARAVASGYVAIGASVLYAVVSVPLALKYLDVSQFGLWMVVVQVTAYLSLVELGMSGSVYRFLIDFKDSPKGPEYASVLSTGAVVFVIQAAALVAIGWGFAPGLARLLSTESDQVPQFARLLRLQCAITAIGLAARGFTVPLQSHQRFDISNYIQVASLLVTLGALWIGFSIGLGLDSLPVSTLCGTVVQTAGGIGASAYLGFLPRFTKWLRPNRLLLRRLLGFGSDIFLLTLGAQLFFASQIIVVSHTAGMEAAGAWALCTKGFSMAQQFVFRIPDFATPALTEMYVKNEHDRLQKRFRDLFCGTLLAAAFSGGLIATANSSFVTIWTGRSFPWSPLDDILLALLLITVSATRCLTMSAGFDKKVGLFRFVYFLQGISFVAAAWIFAPYFGFTGILVCAILADLTWCGVYGLIRTSDFFGLRRRELLQWLAPVVRFASCFAVGLVVLATVTSNWPPFPRFLTNVLFGSAIGFLLLWSVALEHPARLQVIKRISRR